MSLINKWKEVLDHKDYAPIKDSNRKAITAQLLENQDKAMAEEKALISEAAPANVSGNVDRMDPVLIQLVRRSAPNLVHHDLTGVQAMTMPTGLIFAMKARYGSDTTLTDNAEALFNEADTGFSGAGTHQADALTGTFGTGITTATAEGASPAEMGFTIERVSVTAKTRQLKAEYSVELAQDLKQAHGLNAEDELSKILVNELNAEMNRELFRTIYKIAENGAQVGTTTPGTFDLDTDSDGRWSVERFKGLLFQAEREANQIAKRTRRGRGNIIVCTSDVASAFAMSGQLDYAPALSTDLDVDDTGNTFVGVLNKKYKVYIDPYFSSSIATDILLMSYKGSQYDAGLFYCPYVPLTLYRAVDPSTFQPKIGFKTRYGMVSNPLNGDGATLAANSNRYYRLVKVANIL
jgi:hypothetical protein